MSFFLPSADFFTGILNMDPFIRAAQIGLGVLAVSLAYLVFFATRDILKRTHSLAYQLFCILLVACLPVVGFCFYLLIRPSQTLNERDMAENVAKILALLTQREEKIQTVKSKMYAKAKDVKIGQGTMAEKGDANGRIAEALKHTPVSLPANA
ncbi:hypothetical protein A3H16_00765 [Candidatus Kaiserbacteria bacterium RIFCSPLOWO2_12_FULL_53_8]|uniref:Cardiolipin synthase N-terminal domain-containing protein n=1 Tax=Candidatus Kaiserbacteria bacterium RIFCSPLOWO2_12_FULL_53_8 TaxID=1798529 RepID=A0A1F6G296_9BACT|nr:MAG: hypothetical protein A3H16_00765 [Candidatus Kaiserbacteria bacterium RIFCSPLOWO2_12_FULL_53_8]